MTPVCENVCEHQASWLQMVALPDYHSPEFLQLSEDEQREQIVQDVANMYKLKASVQPLQNLDLGSNALTGTLPDSWSVFNEARMISCIAHLWGSQMQVATVIPAMLASIGRGLLAAA